MWQVIRRDSYTYMRPTCDRFGTPTGEEEVTDPPNTVVGEHCIKATAEKHRDKCNRTRKPLRYAIRESETEEANALNAEFRRSELSFS